MRTSFLSQACCSAVLPYLQAFNPGEVATDGAFLMPEEGVLVGANVMTLAGVLLLSFNEQFSPFGCKQAHKGSLC